MSTENIFDDVADNLRDQLATLRDELAKAREERDNALAGLRPDEWVTEGERIRAQFSEMDNIIADQKETIAALTRERDNARATAMGNDAKLAEVIAERDEAWASREKLRQEFLDSLARGMDKRDALSAQLEQANARVAKLEESCRKKNSRIRELEQPTPSPRPPREIIEDDATEGKHYSSNHD